VRPPGADHCRRAAVARLPERRRRQAGQVLRAGSRDHRARPGGEAGRRRRRQGAGQPGDRKLSHRGGLIMKFGIVVFPGSNCDEDALHAARDLFGQDAEYLWHKDADLKGADVLILPGGFAHGDYLRTGAMARFSPIMAPVRTFAERGGPVLGICNGFQILLEAGLLPGAMLRNKGLKYRCEHVHVRVEQTDTPFTSAAKAGQVLRIPIGHGEGNYYAPPDLLKRLEDHRQVVLRYTDPAGTLDERWNPNGSV